MLCLLHHLYIYVITCAYSHIVYTKNQQKLLIFLKPKKTRKNPKKPNPYPRKGQTGIGFFWVTPPRYKVLVTPVVGHLYVRAAVRHLQCS